MVKISSLAVAALLGVTSLPVSAAAQTSDSLIINRRATQMLAIMRGTDVQYDTIFAPAFLAQVSGAQLRAIAAQLASLGTFTITKVTRPAPDGAVPGSALIQLTSDKGYSMPMTLVVSQAAPNLITGLLFGPPARTSGSIDDILKQLRALPGHASLFVARVDGSTLVPIVAEDTARAMAIGSAFKLYVLAELVREIGAGQRHWDDVVRIDSSWKSLPSGILQTWPAGTPVTLQTLATLMISQSDNTAADHLLRTLGRENVERVQAVAGNSHPALNEPFLTTREMFALKASDNSALLARYLNGSAAERRSILASPAIAGRQRQGPDFSNGPNAIEGAEWFATTPDLARVIVWLRDHSASGPASAARGVLSVNKGIAWPAATWKYAAFKGGSEPGVLNLTFLAQRTDGQWMVFVGTWNDPAHEVNETTFLGIVSGARDLLGGAK